MTEPDFVIRSGDDLPGVAGRLTQSDGTPADLTGASVQLMLRGATVEMDTTATNAVVVDAEDGKVFLEWSNLAADPDPGLYFGWWKVTYPSGQVESYPNDSNGFLLRVAA